MTIDEVIKEIKRWTGILLSSGSQCSCETAEAQDMAIKALEEVQQYRTIGTPEELKAAMKYVYLAKQHGTVGQVIENCVKYEAIGTAEECQAAMEKQRAKKLEVRKAKNGDIESELRDFITPKGKIVRCPTCRSCLAFEMKFCFDCGQKLDWSDEE